MPQNQGKSRNPVFDRKVSTLQFYKDEGYYTESESDDVISTNLKKDRTPHRNFFGSFQANTDLALSARQRLHLDIGNK